MVGTHFFTIISVSCVYFFEDWNMDIIYLHIFHSSDIGVTLFDEMAKSFEDELQKIGVGTKIIILSSVKVGKFQGI